MSAIAKIGPDVNNVKDVLVEPVVEFFVGAETERTVTSQDKFVGAPRCRWTYPGRLLEGEQFWQLKNLVGNEASAAVVIDTPTQAIDTSTYKPVIATYNAIMHWPPNDVKIIRYNQWQIPDEGILFTNLEPI